LPLAFLNVSTQHEETSSMSNRRSPAIIRVGAKRRETGPPPRRKRPEALTNREHEILQLIWAGLKNKEIAQRLKISVKTVEAHRANMMKKVRVSNTAQLLKASIQGGMIEVR